MPVPKVTKGRQSTNPEGFPVEHYSASSLIRFTTNPILFKIGYVNLDSFDTTMGISGVVGKAFHKAMEVYYGGSDDHAITDEADAIKYGLQVGTAYIEAYNDGWIKYSSTMPNKQKALEKFVFAFNSYVAYKPNDPGETVVSTEEKMQAHIDIEWRKQKLQLPIKLKGYLDKLVRGTDGKLRIVDYKTCATFSNPDKIDGKKIIQSVQYYLLVHALYGEAPHSMIYQEVKLSKNKDGTPQVREYEVVFEQNDLYFDLYFRLYNDVTRALNGEMVYVPNFEAFYDNEVAIISYIHHLDETAEVAKLMQKHKVTTLTDLLKKQIQKAGNMRKLMKTVAEQFTSEKNLNYEKMTYEERIQTKLLEHGIMLTFDSKIEGTSVDLYRYTPNIGVKLAKLHGYVEDIEQVLGVSGVRILTPIPNTSLVGFEVPTKNRTFPTLPMNKGFEIAIGENVMGEAIRYDLRKAPHMLVAGASGSGKSVFLCSLLDQLTTTTRTELVLIDPKMVELSHYEDSKNVVQYEDSIEHISTTLEGLVETMNYRYKKLKELKKRNIDDTRMPYIFVIIDEYGDLIVQDYEQVKTIDTGEVYTKGDRAGEPKMRTERKNLSKEIEKNVLLLAQKARSAGIHLIITTQRPSTNIITGSIKANFPTKVCLKTAKAVDSVVVLDETGAEKLLGKGDLIFASDEGTVRLQGYKNLN